MYHYVMSIKQQSTDDECLLGEAVGNKKNLKQRIYNQIE